MNLVQFVARAGADVAAFLWPQRCPACGVATESEPLLCVACASSIPRLSLRLCARCLVRGEDPVACARHAGFDVWPAWVYDERAAEVVRELKFGGRSDLAAALAPELARAIAPARFDFVTEVPLHPARERERGYNQAAALADALAERIATPRLERVLERVRPTAVQSRLGPSARRANVERAFIARAPERLAGRRVLLVDDVLTTGATLEACLAALRASGAEATAVALAWAQ